MSAPVFVLEGVALLAGETVTLDGPEGRHAATVQRLGVGERLVLTDGNGTSADGTVLRAARDLLEVEIDHVVVWPPPQPRLVVVQALPKGDRGELAVATMTEVGADVIVPWAAARCVTRWDGERGEKARAKWRTASRESAKQSRRSRFPEVTPLATTRDVADLLGAAALAAVLHEEAVSATGRGALARGRRGRDRRRPRGRHQPRGAGGVRGCRRGDLSPRADMSCARPRRVRSRAGVLLSRTARWL